MIEHILLHAEAASFTFHIIASYVDDFNHHTSTAYNYHTSHHPIIIRHISRHVPCLGLFTPFYNGLLIRMITKILLPTKKSNRKEVINSIETFNWLTTTERRDEAIIKYVYNNFITISPLNNMMVDFFNYRI